MSDNMQNKKPILSSRSGHFSTSLNKALIPISNYQLFDTPRSNPDICIIKLKEKASFPEVDAKLTNSEKAQKFRQEGNEHFKHGRLSQAQAAYTRQDMKTSWTPLNLICFVWIDCGEVVICSTPALDSCLFKIFRMDRC